MPENPTGAPCEYHTHILEEQAKCISDLYKKYEGVATVIAILPEKIEIQTQLLSDMKVSLSVLPEHQAQLAVIAEIIQDYKLHKAEFGPVRDKVTRMDAEWGLVKWGIPIAVTVVNAVIAIVMKLL